MPDISFRMDQRGKVHNYQKDSYLSAFSNKGGYLTMSADDFATWKNAGKRTFSNKVTDPKTGKNFAYHHGNFYEFDKTKHRNLGRRLKDDTWRLGSLSWLGENDAMKNRFDNGELIDRRRPDRTGEALEPLDVGTYKTPVRIGRSYYPALPKANGAWNANNDHIASGESIRRRNLSNAQVAYDEGLTIAIDNPRMHASSAANDYDSYSPTYGSRQQAKDFEPNGTYRYRIDGDVAHPARAFYRDVMIQVEHVPGNDYSGFHSYNQPKLDFTRRSNKLALMGAYRFMFKASGKFNRHIGAGRGFDPDSPGQEFTPSGDRKFRYIYPSLPASQGSLFVSRLTANMKKRRLIK